MEKISFMRRLSSSLIDKVISVPLKWDELNN